ncbi:hypothetical protein SAMN05660297_00107 [Natronincola peptidivorans]|uniref:Aminoacetone oxidase family FAD-binding enzyme n=1 Tax=Natronincola peptidivorans TaxID=426128 RepID=A0A1H9Y973_9FIRM|nr:aminoacetone oxidase family FAD-binding enzyme [Natronincola peptidivorans]SES65374.1 hypothetical protein SAMN05660297_00107 [Natronincola peptidivorans]
MKNSKVLVVGAGPAGLMAAITAAEFTNDVILIEKNEAIGKKLKITGGGRCNITNNSSPEEIMKNTITNSKFLYKSLHAFTSQQLMELIEKNGCPLKIESNQKVFPKSEQSSDIIKVFNDLLIKKRVKVYFQCQLKEIIIEEREVIGIKTDQGKIVPCDSIILATGGVSYPHTGSTGEGFYICEKLGHTILPLKPSLISMVIKEKWLTTMTGISLKNIALKTKIGKKAKSFYGDLLFTHYGISGPAVFELSAYINKLDFCKGGHKIFVDFVPKIQQEELKKLLLATEKSNKQISSVLTEYLPKKLLLELLNNLGILHETSLNQLNRKDRNKLIEALKNFEITIEALKSVKDAIVTSGGISVKEVNPLTMESKIIKGLFFAGEILDVDAVTGGYNLQIAFSTGYIAGIHSVNS